MSNPLDANGVEALLDKLDRIELGARNLDAYLKWILGPESPGHHPTMPSAVAFFRGQFDKHVFEPGDSRFNDAQDARRAPLTSPEEKNNGQ